MTDDDFDGLETVPAKTELRAIGEHTHANATGPSPLGGDVSPAVVARIETGASAPSGAAASASGGAVPPSRRAAIVTDATWGRTRGGRR